MLQVDRVPEESGSDGLAPGVTAKWALALDCDEVGTISQVVLPMPPHFYPLLRDLGTFLLYTHNIRKMRSTRQWSTKKVLSRKQCVFLAYAVDSTMSLKSCAKN